MAKRFTDSRKWDDGWFLELSNDNKILWIYLLDKCNHAGIYKKSPKLELCCLGFTITPEILVPFDDRIKTIDNDKYFIPKFIKFQYGELNPAVNCHKSVIEELKRTVNQPLFKGCSTLMNKNKDKDKDKDIRDRGVGKGGFTPPTIEEVAAYCKERGNNIDPKHFIDKNQSIGWVVGRNRTPVKDWKAVIRTWEHNQDGKPTAVKKLSFKTEVF